VEVKSVRMPLADARSKTADEASRFVRIDARGCARIWNTPTAAAR